MRGSVDNVRRSLARLREALKGTSPREIGEALAVLRQEMSAIQATGEKLANGDAPDRGLKPALAALMREIGVTLQLADRGLALYRNRVAELAALAGGYGASGLPAPAPTGATIEFEG